MTSSWQPTASIETLTARAQVIAKIRAFFAKENILEVDTPLLCHATVTDAYIQSFNTQYHLSTFKQETLYLQTSPEYCMKRLLAAGSGAIYQICKAFRNFDESGRLHNPEFTMLEWYRPGFSYFDLMDEIEKLLHAVINIAGAEKISYAQLFQSYLNIDPHHASVQELTDCAYQYGIMAVENVDHDKDTWLQLLMSNIIEPKIPKDKALFIYDFPATQAALARIRQGNPTVAERFEVYLGGIELANGFQELAAVDEQRKRFEKDLTKRRQLNYPESPVDERFLAALKHGLPDCAGVALGIDRLLMFALEKNSIEEVVSFTTQKA